MQRGDWMALAGVLLSVAALVVASLSLMEDREANKRAATPPTASLRVAGDPKIRLRKGNVEWNEVPGDGSATGGARSGKVDGSVIDVLLENTGDRPALITAAEVTVRRVVGVACGAVGGPVVMTFRYDVRIPGDSILARVPFTVRAEHPFTVAPRAFDRLGISIGPDALPALIWGWIYEVDVALRTDAGAPVNLGRFVLLEPAWIDGLLKIADDPNEARCMREIAGRLKQGQGFGGAQSPALRTLAEGLRRRGFL